MTRPKKLLFICGSSVATSTLAEVKVKQVAKSRGVEIDTYKGKVMDAKNLILSIKPDIVIATAMSDGLRELTKSMSEPPKKVDAINCEPLPSSFRTKISHELFRGLAWYAPAVTGKSSESVVPVT